MDFPQTPLSKTPKQRYRIYTRQSMILVEHSKELKLWPYFDKSAKMNRGFMSTSWSKRRSFDTDFMHCSLCAHLTKLLPTQLRSPVADKRAGLAYYWSAFPQNCHIRTEHSVEPVKVTASKIHHFRRNSGSSCSWPFAKKSTLFTIFDQSDKIVSMWKRQYVILHELSQKRRNSCNRCAASELQLARMAW